jgi:outer membrane biosynthesis protein TonB
MTLALLVHVGAVAAGRLLRPFDPSAVPPLPPEPIQVVFATPVQPSASEPNFFSELPPDRADEAPERADFLSNVDSRARDDAPGGADEGLPAMDGESESPHVEMNQSAEGLPEPAEVPDEPADGVTEPESEPADIEIPPAQTPSSTFLSRQSRARVSDPARQFRREMFGEKAERPEAGEQDFSQKAMSNQDGNVSLSGDISLNTVAWDYAPWLQRFRRDLQKRWYAPYGYYLGAIHGWTIVELEIAPNGDLLRMDVLEEEGHESLKNSSVGALRGAMPYQPLPSHFPKDSLILRIKMIYPDRNR